MTSPTSPASSSTTRSRKVLVPKVWKRPHSTIYGKNVEFGSSLYSDKIGELNGRKFNSELPWTMRNSGGSTSVSSSTAGQLNQGYLSSLLDDPVTTIACMKGARTNDNHQSLGSINNYADLLEMTNPIRNSKRWKNKWCGSDRKNNRIDFYDQYLVSMNKEIDHLNNSSLLNNEPILRRKVFDNYMDFDQELGLFVPCYNNNNKSITSSSLVDGCGTSNSSSSSNRSNRYRFNNTYDDDDDDGGGRSLLWKNTLVNKSDNINTKSFVPLPTKFEHSTNLLPKHNCQLMSSPYGQSADGRKLSLGSINPQSYRPSLPQKTTTAHASDGEEFEFQDRSSPFYTDRWAGKTIRHFDSDLYSNASLFKSMIL